MLPLEMVHNGDGFVLAPIEDEPKIEKDEKPEICYRVADWWDGRKLERRIVSAANRFELKSGEKLVIPGARHYSPDMVQVLQALKDQIVKMQVWGDDQGFIDQWGEYFTREQACIIAHHAGQIRKKTGPSDELFSEDLY